MYNVSCSTFGIARCHADKILGTLYAFLISQINHTIFYNILYLFMGLL